jgi:hypothetical protein
MTRESKGSPIKTAAELRSEWGAPDQVVVHDVAEEEWIYEQPFWRWYGIGFYALVVPIAITLPFGSEYVSITVQDGRLVAATRVRSAIFYAACGYFAVSPFDKGCGAGRFEGSMLEVAR